MQFNFQIRTYDQYKEFYKNSIDFPEEFWSQVANEFYWKKKWDKVLEWDFLKADTKWFINGKLNISENCIDRHLPKYANAPAIIWEPNNIDEPNRVITYKELYYEVNKFANVLKNIGVKKGDRVCLYMGMIPELSIAMLACARIGAIHSVIFAGFSSQSIADRLKDAQSEFVITCDGAYRGNKVIPLKVTVDDAIKSCDFVKKVVVFIRTNIPIDLVKDRDLLWHDAIKNVEDLGNPLVHSEEMDSEDPLFILYTSGSTGKPKGVVHSTAGYIIYATYTFVNVFQYKHGDVHFCYADIGWVTGHTYVLYGVLCAGGTTVMYEGLPAWPNPERIWDIIDKYKINIFITAPTVLRSLMVNGKEQFHGKDLNSLKVLGTCGEPINEEAWQWYDKNVGKGRCPIVDTWWQTENGGIMLSNIAGITPSKACFVTLPLPGIFPVLVDDFGNEIIGNNVSGNLCIKFPWPAIIRTTYNDHERCIANYFSTYKNMYCTGDGAYRDENGFYRITGRVDDVLNVSAHRIGTAEIENAINTHTNVIESAVVGYPHELKGQGIYAFVILENSALGSESLKSEIIETVARVIGPIVKPDKIQFVLNLPKTRSGKIMRRFLREIANGNTKHFGDTTLLIEPAVLNDIASGKL